MDVVFLYLGKSLSPGNLLMLDSFSFQRKEMNILNGYLMAGMFISKLEKVVLMWVLSIRYQINYFKFLFEYYHCQSWQFQLPNFLVPFYLSFIFKKKNYFPIYTEERFYYCQNLNILLFMSLALPLLHCWHCHLYIRAGNFTSEIVISFLRDLQLSACVRHGRSITSSIHMHEGSNLSLITFLIFAY